jgi:ankyrin repeat protein
VTKGAIVSTRSLPARPDLGQLKLQARELLRDHRKRNASAAGRIAANHPRMKGKSIAAVLDGALALADAQLVLAREYGFENWAKLKERVERGKKIENVKAHPRFAEALEALRDGNVERLREVIGEAPELVKARTNLEPPYGYFSGATLLNHVAANPGWERPLPKNIVEVARVLLELGADVDAMTMGPNRGTTMGLVITSKQASDSNVSAPLIDLLLEYGAKLDLKGKPDHVVPDWERMNALDLPLTNHATRAAERMIELGAEVDVCAAAALGRMDLLRDCFDEDGELKERPYRRGKRMSARDAIGLALLFAYVNNRKEAVDFVLEKDGNWDMTGVNNGAAMHRAAWEGDLEMVKRLIAKGADIYNRDNPFNSTPLSWAQHNKQQAVFDWMRTNCRIDLHEAVGFDLREHVEARLREDPTSVNRRLDHWEFTQCVPLHWAAWTSVEDVDGRHYFDLARRKELVELLLKHGAEVNVVAGNGMTPVDIAEADKAPEIVEILRRYGGKRAGEL